MSYKVSTKQWNDGSKDYRYETTHATTGAKVVFIIRKAESWGWTVHEITEEYPDHGEWCNTYATKKTTLAWSLRQLAGR